MFSEGKWKIQLKRNGRIVELDFNNLILNDAINFNFDYKVSNTTGSIITHMFLSTAHSDVSATDTTMGGVVIAKLPYIDYIKPNYDNANSNVSEHTLVFKYNPTETVVVRQIGTGRPTSGENNRFFSIANIVDTQGERAELTLKPGDELTLTYVLTIIGHMLEEERNGYADIMKSKAALNNLMKANPNWGLAGFQRQLDVMVPLITEHLGTAVTASFALAGANDRTSSFTGLPVRMPIYTVRWTAVTPGAFKTVPLDKWSTEFFATLMFPWNQTYINSNMKPAPAGDVWFYNQQFWITPGSTAVERFDHTKQAAILKPKLPTSYKQTLVDAGYNFPQSTEAAAWDIEIEGADPLAQVIVVQNGRLAVPRPSALQFVNKNGKYKSQFKITELRRNQPFFVHFYNRAGLTKYGPLFVQDPIAIALRGTLHEPKLNKGAELSEYFYSSSKFGSHLYIRPEGRITNDEDRKTIFACIVDDYNRPDTPSDYTEVSNQYSSDILGLYEIMVRAPRTITSLQQNPNSRIRIKISREAVEFYDIPIVLPRVIPGKSDRRYPGSAPRIEVVKAEFKIKKV